MIKKLYKTEKLGIKYEHLRAIATFGKSSTVGEKQIYKRQIMRVKCMIDDLEIRESALKRGITE